jgi:hypothetical protein
MAAFGAGKYIQLEPVPKEFPVTFRRAVSSALFLCVLSAITVAAQPGNRHLDMKARVLDLVFPLDFASEPYFEKLILRFGDSDTQLVVLVYFNYPARPGGNSEIIRYSIAGMDDGELSQLISKMVVEKPDVKPEEIAAKLKVTVTRSSIDSKALDRALRDLRAVRISPILGTGICVDQCPEFDFWYDDGQDSVHYTISGDGGESPQEKLVQWMIRFREDLPGLLKPPSASRPSE